MEQPKKKKLRFKIPAGYDSLLLLACLALSFIGIIFIGSASITSSETVMQEVVSSVVKQVIFLVISLVAMGVFSHIDIDKNARYKTTIASIVVGGLLLACLLFSARNAARAWIVIPVVNMTIQPSEFAKIIMILEISTFLCFQPHSKTVWQILAQPLITLAIYIFIIIFLQNDTGSAIALFLITCLCLMIPTHDSLKKLHRILLLGMFIMVIGCLFLFSPMGSSILKNLPMKEYQLQRIEVVSAPFDYLYGSGYQVCNSLIAFTRGGLLGRGLGQGIQKFGYLPYASSDFIIAVIADEGGFIMILAVFILYGLILQRLLKYAFKVKRQQNRVILFGTASYLFVHFLLNVGGATALIPLTGVPLLMLSAGGTSLLSWYIMVGLCQGIIFKYNRGKE